MKHALALVVWLVGGTAVSDDEMICMTTDQRERVRELLLDAIDQGLREYTVQLFQVMIKDPTDQPHRMIAGMRPAITVFVKAQAALGQWSPPICERKQ